MKFIIIYLYLFLITIAYSKDIEFPTEFKSLSTEEIGEFVEKYGTNWPKYQSFIEKTFIPMFGRVPFHNESFQMGEDQWSWNLYGKNFTIKFHTNDIIPKIISNDNTYTLHLSWNVSLKEIPSLLKKFFLSTEFHPSLHSSDIIQKRSLLGDYPEIFEASLEQDYAFLEKFIESQSPSAIVIEPNRRVQEALILKTLSKLFENSDSQILIITEDKDIIQKLSEEFKKHHLECASEIAIYTNKLNENCNSITQNTRIVFATLKSWVGNESLFSRVTHILIPEAHYAGSNYMNRYIKKFQKQDHFTQIIGVTATPFHHQQKGQFLDIFKERFPSNQEDNPSSIEELMMDQLTRSMGQDALPIDAVNYFSVNDIEGAPFRLKRIHNEIHLSDLEANEQIMLEAFFKIHAKGFISVDPTSAQKIYTYLQATYPSKTFEFCDSALSLKERKTFLKRFKNEESLFCIYIKKTAPNKTYIINPLYYESIFKHLEPFLNKHDHGLITVSDIQEAEDICNALRLQFPGKSFEYNTSDLPLNRRRDLLKRLKNKEPLFIISVRMLDIVQPYFSLLVDLAPSVSPRLIMDKIKLLSQPAPGKFDIDWVQLTEYKEEDLIEAIGQSTSLPKFTKDGTVTLQRGSTHLSHFIGNVLDVTLKVGKFFREPQVVEEVIPELSSEEEEEIFNELLDFQLKQLEKINKETIDTLEPCLQLYINNGMSFRQIGSFFNELKHFSAERAYQKIEYQERKLFSLITKMIQEPYVYEYFNQRYGTAFLYSILTYTINAKWKKCIDSVVIYYQEYNKLPVNGETLKALDSLIKILRHSEESYSMVKQYMFADSWGLGKKVFELILKKNKINVSTKLNFKVGIDLFVRLFKASINETLTKPQNITEDEDMIHVLLIEQVIDGILSKPHHMKYLKEKYPDNYARIMEELRYNISYMDENYNFLEKIIIVRNPPQEN